MTDCSPLHDDVSRLVFLDTSMTDPPLANRMLIGLSTSAYSNTVGGMSEEYGVSQVAAQG